MKTRIISGLAMTPLMILILLGGYFITAAVFLIAVIGIKELFNGFGKMDVRPSYPIAIISVVMLYGINIIGGKLLLLSDAAIKELYLLWIFVSVLMALLYLFKIEERQLSDGMATVIGIVYVGFFSYHAVLTEDAFADKCNFSPVWLIIATAFVTDISAYFGGYFLGKHKLCPVISPKKTVEGSVSGILGAVIVTVLLGYFMIDSSKLGWYAIIGAAGGIVSQFGDLTASIFKRNMGIKDYGTLIPGHGGIMDRFDSVLFTAPMVYYIMQLMYGVQ